MAPSEGVCASLSKRLFVLLPKALDAFGMRAYGPNMGMSLDSVYSGKHSFDAHLAPCRGHPSIPQHLSTLCKGTFAARQGSRRAKYAPCSRMTLSRGRSAEKVIPWGAPTSTSRAIWTAPAWSCRHRLSVRHLASHQVPSGCRQPMRPASRCRLFLHAIAGHPLLSRQLGNRHPNRPVAHRIRLEWSQRA